MKNQNLAQRYAKALLELAEEEGISSRIAEELNHFQRFLDESEELRTVFINPVFPAEQRHLILDEIMKRGEFHRTTRNFLSLLIDKKRTALFSTIRERFAVLLDEMRRRLTIEVTSAQPLSEDYLEKLKAVFEKKTGYKVEFDLTLDEQLLAGVKVRIGHTVYDGSLQARLRQMEDYLSHSVR